MNLISDNTLPANLRFLIASRPESDILDAFGSGLYFVHKQMGDISAEDVDEDLDVRKFICHSLNGTLSWRLAGLTKRGVNCLSTIRSISFNGLRLLVNLSRRGRNWSQPLEAEEEASRT